MAYAEDSHEPYPKMDPWGYIPANSVLPDYQVNVLNVGLSLEQTSLVPVQTKFLSFYRAPGSMPLDLRIGDH